MDGGVDAFWVLRYCFLLNSIKEYVMERPLFLKRQ